MKETSTFHKGSVQAVLDQLGFGWYQVRVIIILGIAQAADTMETFIQAILGPTLRCGWNLSSDYVAMLATMVFLGVCIGSPLMGYISDHLGRKSISILCCLALAYMTVLCTVVPTYSWLASLRFIAGFYISGLLAAANSMISEFMPEVYQATGQLMVCSFDSLVALYITGAGYGCMVAGFSWRIFLLLTIVPLLLSAAGLAFMLDESPLLLSHWGKNIKAAKILDRIAKVNNRVPKQTPEDCEGPMKPFSFVGRLHESVKEDTAFDFSLGGFGRVIKILVVDYTTATALLVWINIILGLIIYGGTTLLPVEIPSNPRTCLQSLSHGMIQPAMDSEDANTANSGCCIPLLKEGYYSLLSSAIGSFMSFPIALGLITLIGRKWTIHVCFLLTAILLFVEAFCIPPSIMRIVFFATRAIAAAGGNATSIYITGLYSPQIRSLTFGLMCTFYRLGVLGAPLIGQIFLQRVSVLGAIILFSSLSLIGAFLTIFLPHSGGPTPTGKARKIFRNIFKKRAPVTAARATAAAAGDLVDESSSSPPNSAWSDDHVIFEKRFL